MQIYKDQRFEFKQKDVLYFHGGVRLYKNERQMTYTENDEQKHYYLYDIEEYTQIEYTEKLAEENRQLKTQLETAEHRIAMTEDVINEIILGGM